MSPRTTAFCGGILMLLVIGVASLTATRAHPLTAPGIPSCFSQVPSPNPGPNPGSHILHGVAVVSSTDVWAVGNTNGDTLALHWDGTTWVQVPSPAGGELYGVAVVNATNVWAVGSTNGHTLILHWDGGSWTQVPSPSPGSVDNELQGVSVVSPSDIWAVGIYRSGSSWLTLTLHWDGSTWTQVPSPNPGTGSNQLYGVSALAPNNVWAVGASGPGGSMQTLILHWDGSTWTPVLSPNGGTQDNLLYSVSAVSANDIWAVGYYTNPAPLTLTLHWNGTSWSQVASPNPGVNADLLGTYARSSNDVWAVGFFTNGASRQPLILHWDGAFWTQVFTPPIPDSNLYAVVPISDSDIWTVGYANSSGGTETLILHSCADTTPSATATGTPNPSGTRTGTPTVVPTTAATSTTMPETPTATATTPSNTPTATPTIGAYCANVVWTDRVNTTVNSQGYLVKTGGVDGAWDAGAVTTLGILAAPACFRIEGVSPGAERVVGLTSHETSPGFDDIDYGIYFGPTGILGVVDGGQRVPGNFGTYSAADSFQIAVEGSAGTAVNYYRNGAIFYSSPHPAQLPLFGDAAIASLDGNIAPSRECGNGPPQSPTPTETACPLHFTDVQPSDYFAAPVQYLACHGVVSGYADGTFRPYANTTRSQQVKIVVLGFAVPSATPPATGYTFHDVPPAFPFYAVIETAAAQHIVSGYTCGGPGEPCDEQGRPYFRPYANVTRNQLTKIVIGAAAWPLANPASPTFADVPAGSAFYPFVETAVCRGLISGYGCGGPGEPCDAQQRPYFRGANSATRGQIAKIVYGAITSQAPCPLLAERYP